MARNQPHRRRGAAAREGRTARALGAHSWVRLSTLAIVFSCAASAVRAQPAEPAPLAVTPAPESAQPESTQPAPDAANVQAQQQAEQDSAMSAMDMEARQHFTIGKTLYEAGRFQQAAEEFEQAYQLSKRPQLLYNVYVANREAGKLPQAITALSGYLEHVPDAPDRINLRARLDSMQQQVARQLEQEERARRATEEAERAKAKPRTRKVTEHSAVPWYLVGTGGALLAGGLVTGIFEKQKADQLSRNCFGTSCPSSESNTIQTAQHLALATDILWISGAATAVTGLVLWWTGALDTEREVPVAGVSAVPHGAMATWKARF